MKIYFGISNIQHATPNIQCPEGSAREFTGCWMFPLLP